MSAQFRASSGSMVAAIHFQRQANEWLTDVRQRATAAGCLPFVSRHYALDVLDVLRSELNLRNGEALARLTTSGPYIPAVASLGRRLRTRLSRMKSYVAGRRGTPVSALRSFGDGGWVAFPRMPAHAADLLPVVRILRDQYQVDTAFGVVDTRMVSMISDASFPAFGLYSHSYLQDIASLLAIRRYRTKLFHFLEHSTSSVLDQRLHAVLVEQTKHVLREQLLTTAATAEGVIRAIRRLSPRGILVGNCYTLEGRAAAKIAASQGVFVAAIEHGSIFPNDPIWQESPVDLICTWGEPSRRALLTCGVPDESICVTGAPRHDAVFQRVAEIAATCPPKDYILVAIGGPGDQVRLEQHCKFIRMLYQAAQLAPEIKWLVKLHKKDSSRYYPPTGFDSNPQITIHECNYLSDGLEIFDFLMKSRGIVTIASTVGSEAMALEVPVITVDIWHPDPAIEGIEFIDRGCTHRVRTAEELAVAVRAVWRGEIANGIESAAAEYAREHFVNRGAAARRIAQRLMEVS